MDNKLMQGLLVTACGLLLFAIILTTVEALSYKEGAIAAGRAPAVAAPSRTPTAPVAPATTPVLQAAPAGTVGYVTVNVRGLLASAMFQDALTEGEPVPEYVEQIESATFFFASATGTPEDVQWCGVMKMAGTTQAEIAAVMAEEGSTVAVDGVEAYVMDAPMGGEAALLAPVDDSTILIGGDEAALALVIKSHGGEGRADVSEMQALGSGFASKTVSGALIPTDEMKADFAAEADTPAWAAGAEGAAFGLNVTDSLALDLALRLASDADADAGASDISGKLEEAKVDMQSDPMGAMLVPIVDRLKITSKGSDLTVGLTLGSEDMEAVGGLVMMGMMGAMGGMEMDMDMDMDEGLDE